MAYRANPFLERMSESTTTDQEFVRLFSPRLLERLEEEAFKGAVHIFRSPPGGGKTTLLRAFTPLALLAFWNARGADKKTESYQRLVALGALHEHEGPQVLGVLLSCASGYADLPPGATINEEGLFRALLDCRIVLRALRSLSALLGFTSVEQLDSVRLEYIEPGKDLKSIPATNSARDLAHWAEQCERDVYNTLDSVVGGDGADMPKHIRIEGVLWLQSVRLIHNRKTIIPRRMLMIDDLHKLRRRQRTLLIEELTEIRPAIPVWLAERSIVLGEELLSQGTREGRDLYQYALDDLWVTSRGQQQFAGFAQILDRRLEVQSRIPPGTFSQYLRTQFHPHEEREAVQKGIEAFQVEIQRHRTNPRYTEWLTHAESQIIEPSIDSLRELYGTRILLARDELRRQMTLELGPLPAEELDERDSSQLQAAAEIFIHDDLKIPYYFGIERLCTMATNNVEELLTLAAALYDALLAKQVLRKPEILSPSEQEKLLKGVAKKKRDFIPKNHTEGTRAQQLLDSIGSYCRERTFLPNAPYAPGVTGVRLSQTELGKLNSRQPAIKEQFTMLKRVLSECVAENLLVTRDSSASTSRESGLVFYLNRTLCAHYGLPLQMGGWQDVVVEDLADWIERGRPQGRRKLLETR
jgi:hypothetical protein